MKRLAIFVAAVLGAVATLYAQENVGIPAEVYYLMPKMEQGTILYSDRSPAPGVFNICALDNTVRFQDKRGDELILEDDETLVEVIIGDVPFLRRDGVFYRLDKLTDEVFLATKREVVIMNDSKEGAYGMESNTTAIQTMEFIRMDSRILSLDDLKEVPYRMTETSGLYRKGSILSLTKRNLQRCFPEKKAEIEAWFNTNKKLDPGKYQEVLAQCKEWAE